MKATMVSAFLAVAALAAPQTQNTRSIPVDGQAKPDEIPCSVLQFGSSSTYPQGGAFVLSTKQDWKGFLAQIGDTTKKSFVNWKTEQLIVVQLAPSTAAPLGFKVARLRQKKDGVDVEIVINKPGGAGLEPHQPRTVKDQVSPYEVLMTKRFTTPLQTVVVDD